MKTFIKPFRLILIVIGFSLLFSVTAQKKGDPKASILRFEIDFYPNEVGFYKGKTGTHYFAVSKRRIVFLDNRFKQVERFILDQDVSAFDFGDVNKDGRDDLILIGQDGISIQLQEENGKFAKRVLTIKETINVPLTPEDVARHEIAFDVDKDGKSDLIVPGIGRYVYYNNVFGEEKPLEVGENQALAAAWVMAIELPIPHNSTFSSEVLQYSGVYGNSSKAVVEVPKVYLADFNNDGLLDMYLRHDKIFFYFLSAKPSSDDLSKNKNLDKNTSYHFIKRIARVYPVSTSGHIFTNAYMHDVNKDGKLDLIFSVVRGNGVIYNTQSYIYWGGNEFVPEVEKRFYTERKGAFLGMVPLFNKNKELTFFYPNVEIGVGTAMAFLMGKSLTVNLASFAFSKNNLDEKSNFNISVNTEGGAIPGFAVGDYNGDGFTDIAIGFDTKQIFIYRGSDKMSKDVLAELNIAGTANFKNVPSENGDELMVYYPYFVKDLDRKYIYLVRFIK